MNIVAFINKFVWCYRQELTKKPRSLESVVSDLFIWRKSREFATYFDVINTAKLFAQDAPNSWYVNIVIFDRFGKQMNCFPVQTREVDKITIDLSQAIKNIDQEYGTFSVFRSETPESVKNQESYITERGYTSYRYKDSPLRSYVHGNYDAIAKPPENYVYEMVGGSSFFRRKYFLQHYFFTDYRYELFFVNPTNRRQRIDVYVIDKGNKCNSKSTFYLDPRESTIHEVIPVGQKSRVVLSSNMVMCRPVIFRFRNNKLDVYHG